MISVVIAAYNAEAYLPEALDSLLSQDYAHWEALVVDDSSTDRTADIIKEHARKDARIRPLHCPHGGQAAARNAGVAEARGEWLAFLDADDCFHPQALSALLLIAEAHRLDVAAADMVHGNMPEWRRLHNAPIAIMSGRDALEDMLYQERLSSSVCDKLIRTELVRKAAFRPGTYYEDLEILGRLLPQARHVGYSPLPLYFYRQHSASFIHTFADKRLDVLTVTEEIERRCQGQPTLLAAARDRRFAANYNMFLLCSAAHHTAAKACWEVVKSLRHEVLANRRSRLKNKLGALLSYLGPGFAAHLPH